MYISNDYRNYLSHHGVLGMHWGVRRYQPYGEGGYNPKKKGKEIGEAKNGRITRLKKRIKTKNDERNNDPVRIRKRQAKQDVKNRFAMSDAELNKKIERLKKEKELKTLTEENLYPGRTFIKRTITGSGKTAVTKIAGGTALYGGRFFISKLFGNTVAGGIYQFIKKK